MNKNTYAVGLAILPILIVGIGGSWAIKSIQKLENELQKYRELPEFHLNGIQYEKSLIRWLVYSPKENGSYTIIDRADDGFVMNELQTGIETVEGSCQNIGGVDFCESRQKYTQFHTQDKNGFDYLRKNHSFYSGPITESERNSLLEFIQNRKNRVFYENMIKEASRNEWEVTVKVNQD